MFSSSFTGKTPDPDKNEKKQQADLGPQHEIIVACAEQLADPTADLARLLGEESTAPWLRII